MRTIASATLCHLHESLLVHDFRPNFLKVFLAVKPHLLNILLGEIL